MPAKALKKAKKLKTPQTSPAIELPNSPAAALNVLFRDPAYIELIRNALTGSFEEDETSDSPDFSDPYTHGEGLLEEPEQSVEIKFPITATQVTNLNAIINRLLLADELLFQKMREIGGAINELKTTKG